MLGGSFEGRETIILCREVFFFFFFITFNICCSHDCVRASRSYCLSEETLRSRDSNPGYYRRARRSATTNLFERTIPSPPVVRFPSSFHWRIDFSSDPQTCSVSRLFSRRRRVGGERQLAYSRDQSGGTGGALALATRINDRQTGRRRQRRLSSREDARDESRRPRCLLVDSVGEDIMNTAGVHAGSMIAR